VSFFFLPSSPDHAHFFNDEEKSYVKAKLKEDGAIEEDDSFSWGEVTKAFTSVHVLFVGVIFFFSGRTLSFDLPAVLKYFQGSFFIRWLSASRPFLFIFSPSSIAISFTPSIVQTLGYTAARAQLMSVPPFSVAFVCQSHRPVPNCN